jgi:hypothetical protein
MEKRVDLEVILNIKKAYDKKIDAMRQSLKKNNFLLRKLEIVGLPSSEKEVQDTFRLIARFSKENHLIVVVSGAEKLFRQLKIILAELVNYFFEWVDDLVNQLVAFHIQERAADHKILRQIFDAVFNTAQFNAVQYRILYHPQFLRMS